MMNTSGPDVLTSCGQYGLILTVGESYIVGIGGPCSVLNDWSSFNSYSSSEIELLEPGSCNVRTEKESERENLQLSWQW